MQIKPRPKQNPRFEQQAKRLALVPNGAAAPRRSGSRQKYRKQPHAK
jgi:hypothetical protein